MSSIDIIDELSNNFLVSSLDTNIGRAFPDVRDGLKPGMRTILWEMYTNKYLSSKPHVKSAKISGGVIAKWWPHSDVAIYDTFARMSQSFTNNVPEIDFHGNNGNIILGGDAVANQRYTEARLASVIEEGMFTGINKNNVDMILNFSEDAYMPKVLPAIFPRLLVNGSQGIGVSIANVWLPHSFTETAKLIIDYITGGVLDEDNYYPDFPTGGVIVNKDELSEINKTGKGKVVIEAAYKIKGKEIDFYEMPYQTYIEPVIEQIKEAIDKDKITGIKSVYNKSDKNKISLVVACSTNPENVVKELFENTDLRKQFNANQNGIVSKTPVLLTLKEVIDVYLKHNMSCIKKEYEYDYEKAMQRIHILEALLKAVDNIDDIINIIRTDKNPKEKMMSVYSFDDEQATAVLNMKLSSLSRLEKDKLIQEKEDKEKIAANAKEIVEDTLKQKTQIAIRLQELVNKYGDKRRTQIIQKDIVKTTTGKAKTAKEFVPDDVVICVNKDGYIKNIPVKNYKSSLSYIFSIKTDTSDMVVLFSNKGKYYRLQLKQLKQCGHTDKGIALGSILNFEQGEKIIFGYTVSSLLNKNNILFVTKNGSVKKTNPADYVGATKNINGLKSITLKDNDAIVDIFSVKDGDTISLYTENNIGIKFNIDGLNIQGKSSGGVKGITLVGGDFVKDSVLNNNDGLSPQARGGKGRKVKR